MSAAHRRCVPRDPPVRCGRGSVGVVGQRMEPVSGWTGSVDGVRQSMAIERGSLPAAIGESADGREHAGRGIDGVHGNVVGIIVCHIGEEPGGIDHNVDREGTRGYGENRTESKRPCSA